MASLWTEFHCGKPVPLWYRLSVPNAETITLLISKQANNFLCENLSVDSWIVKREMQEFGSASFYPPTHFVWGFEGSVLNIKNTEPDWVRYDLPLPQYIKDSDGVGYTESSSSRIIAVSVSLTVILQVLNNFDPESFDNERYQLMTIDNFRLYGDMSGAGISACVGPVLRKWLATNSDSSLNEVREAMQNAYNHLNPSYFQEKYSFQASISNPDRLMMKVPGTCACLGPDWHGYREEGCYIMSPHNTDSVDQQLTLFSWIGKNL